MGFDPKSIAVAYYFGDVSYWKLPRIAADALNEGYDGPALRKLAGLADRDRKAVCEDDIPSREVDSAFREMGIDAPIAQNEARLTLAIESAQRALNGSSNVFDEATYIRIHLCKLSELLDEFKPIVALSKEAKNAPRSQWNRIEVDLQGAFRDFLNSQRTQAPG